MTTETVTAINVTETPESIKVTRVDIPPTWGAIGRIVWLLIAGREWKALAAYREELARVFAMAQALTDIAKDLDEAQQQKVAKSMAQSLTEQGF